MLSLIQDSDRIKTDPSEFNLKWEDTTAYSQKQKIKHQTNLLELVKSAP